MIKWLVCISSGMKYLSDKKMVHRDLRNCCPSISNTSKTKTIKVIGGTKTWIINALYFLAFGSVQKKDY